MSAPLTPTNVYLQSGNTVAYISWDQMSGATSYVVQKSQDNITYTTLTTITGSTQYVFTVSALTQYVQSGSTYTNNSQTFTLVGNYELGSTSITCTGTGAPSTGTLTYASGYGPGTITFSASQTNTFLPNNYTDTTGAPGQLYYYQVAAVNGSGTSAYSTPQSCIIVDIGIECLGSLRFQAQSRADFINNSFVTLPEWNRYISQSHKELYDILIQKYGNDYYYKTPYVWTTLANTQLYPLPKDFYKAYIVEVALNANDPNSWITLRRFMRVQQNLWNYPNVYTFYGVTNLRYRFTGNNLQLVPIAQANQTVRLWYAPRPKQLLADTDLISGVSGWEEYIVIDAAIKAKLKREDDVSALMQEKADMLKRIEEAAENRDLGDPETVSDSRTRNFGWTESGGENGGNGFW